jgi:hypothetical protein
MATISGMSNIGLDKATVTMSATPDSAAVDMWRVTPNPLTSDAVESSVYHVKRTGASVVVYFSPPLSPTANYTIQVTETTGSTDTTSTHNFTAPSGAKPLAAEWSHGILRAWSRSVTQLVQEFSGVPCTLLTQDIQPAESSIYVESTLGFPLVGYVWVGDARYRYTSRGPTAFHGVTRDDPTVAVEPRRQLVYLDTASVWPVEGTPYLMTTGRKYTDPNGVL